jgi:hypothetical protein
MCEGVVLMVARGCEVTSSIPGVTDAPTSRDTGAAVLCCRRASRHLRRAICLDFGFVVVMAVPWSPIDTVGDNALPHTAVEMIVVVASCRAATAACRNSEARAVAMRREVHRSES